jgi:hypothetical protein
VAFKLSRLARVSAWLRNTIIACPEGTNYNKITWNSKSPYGNARFTLTAVLGYQKKTNESLIGDETSALRFPALAFSCVAADYVEQVGRLLRALHLR